MNILFICSRNKWRSRTAETIFQNDQRFNVRSAGTENSARVRVSEKHISWADLIFVMEKHHKQKITERFRALLNGKRIVILNITDDYEYMDEELIEMLKVSVETEISSVI